jgi:hypothetical protein
MTSIKDLGSNIINKIPGIGRPEPNSLKKHLTDSYARDGYMDKYGGSVIITSLILATFGGLFGYNYFLSNLKYLKKNWTGIRCNPLFIPFAGLINAPSGVSKMTYTAENLNYCLTDILKDVVKVESAAQSAATQGIADGIGAIGNDMNSARSLFSNIRKSIGGIFSSVFSKIFNVMVPLRIMLAKSKTALNRSQGVLSTAMYTGIGTFLSTRSFIGAFLAIVTAIIVIAVLLGIGDLASAFAVLWFPFVGWALASVWFLAFTVIMLLVIMTLAVFIPAAEVSSLVIQKTNTVNRLGSQFHEKESFANIANNEINNFCFDENTEIKLKNGEIKQIKDICIGDTIIDGGKVTATFKSTSKNQEMYVLNNILVTGDHTLLDEELGVIKVKKHPNSIKYGEYYKPFVYCINTTTKRIIIDNIKFLDWDEVDDMDIVMVRQEMKDLLPERFHLKDIHKFLECGLHPNTLIELDDGRSVPIKQIQVNDQLRFGEQVLGIVEINGKDVDKVKEYEINGFKFIGSSNLRMYSKDLGGCVSTLDMGGIPVKKPRKLYHIITDSKFLRINGTIFFDYNGGLESILWRKDGVDNLDNN